MVADSDVAFDGIGRLFAGLGTPRFASTLFDFFNDMLLIDHCVAFVFPMNASPFALVVEGSDTSAAAARNLAHEYVGGAFVSDPVLARINQTSHQLTQSPLVGHLPASAIDDSSYRRRFYDEPKISEEIHLAADLAGARYYACLFRNSSQPAFSKEEIKWVDRCSGMVMAALRRQSELVGAAASALQPNTLALSAAHRGRLLQQVRETLRQQDNLSPREADVCAHIALGYTIVATSLNLGITVNTAATHRKRAYAKLGICSQNELFVRYLHAMA